MQKENLTLHVEGMACGHCEAAIGDALRRLPGVKKAKASKRKNAVAVVYDADAVAPDEISKAITDIGYEVIS